MQKFKFRIKGDTIYATSQGWTNAYTPDGEVDTSLEHHQGELIARGKAASMLDGYGWRICGNCGNITPSLGDCSCSK